MDIRHWKLSICLYHKGFFSHGSQAGQTGIPLRQTEMFSEHHATGILPDNMSIIICSKYNFLYCTLGYLVVDIFLCPFIFPELVQGPVQLNISLLKTGRLI